MLRYSRKTPHLKTSCSLVFCSLLSALPVAMADDTADTVLPSVEVRSKRSPHDPRPATVNTATKTDVDARYVPQTINSVQVSNVISYGGRDMADALIGVPGISNNADTRFDSFKIRGFSNSGDLLLDGMRDDAQYVRSLGNIERVEVLKGPAAVLYGRGSGGGVINRISKQPGRDVQSSIGLTAGSQGLLGIAADINHVLADEWTMRINAGRERKDSFRDAVDSTRQYLAPSLKWENAQSSWLLQAEYTEYERVPDRGMPARVTAFGTDGKSVSYALPPAPINTFYGAQGWDYLRDKTLNLRSSFSHKLNSDWELRHSISMLDLDNQFDNTFVTSNYVATKNPNMVSRSRYRQDLHQRNWQSNLELSGNIATGGVVHKMMVGAEYSKQNRNPDIWNSAALPVSILNPRNSVLSNSPFTPFQIRRHKAKGLAAYMQDQILFSPQWQLLAGLRWDHFNIDSTNLKDRDTAGRPLQSKRSSSALSPRLGIVWTPVPDHSLYASYSKNFAPVGGDSIGITPNLAGNTNDLGPQYSRQYEVGVKSDWVGGGISTSLSIFQLDLYNRTVQDPVTPGIYYQNGLERNRGIELGINGQLASNWFIHSGFAVQNAKLVAAEAKYQGKRSTGAAAKNGNVFVSYAPTLGWFAETGLIYEGARFADRDNLLELPGYTRWDGQLGYRLKNAEVTFAVTNLSNRAYYTSAGSLSQIIPGSPRAAVLNVTYKY